MTEYDRFYAAVYGNMGVMSMHKGTVGKLIISCAAVFAAGLLFGGCADKNVSDDEAVAANADITDTSSETEASFTEPVPENSSVHVLAVGDNLVSAPIYEQAHRRAMGVGYDFGYEYANTAKLVRSADVAIINQETLICNDEYEPSEYPYFNSPRDLGNYMQYMGFDIFTIANNHILDKGEDGLLACLDYWDSCPDAVVAGVYRNEADKENIRTYTSNGVTFSILAYTESTNTLTLPESSELIIGDAYDLDGIVSDIKKAKEKSDICILALHWGVENSDEVSRTQRDVAQRFADAGADVIIGNHPHVLRSVETIEGKDGNEMLCAYSLGNYVSSQERRQNLIGGILEFDVEKNGSEFSIDNITLTPTIQHYEKGGAKNRVYLYSQYSEELAEQHGINEIAEFNMEYIDSIINKNIDEKYLKLN